MRDGDFKTHRARMAMSPAPATQSGDSDDVFELFGVTEDITEQVSLARTQRRRLSTVEGLALSSRRRRCGSGWHHHAGQRAGPSAPRRPCRRRAPLLGWPKTT